MTARAHALLVLTALVPTVRANYVCTSVGTECANRDYSSGSYATDAALIDACLADDACLAYDWNADGEYGFKCTTTSSRVDSHDEFKFCYKSLPPSPPPSPPPAARRTLAGWGLHHRSAPWGWWVPR